MSATFDTTTKAAYAAASTAQLRAEAVVASLTGTISVKVFDGSDSEMGSGTMAAPWATATAGAVVLGEVSSFTVGTTATPDADWYLRLQNADVSRWVKGSFGLSSSGQDFTWSLPAWTATDTGTIGTATIVCGGNEAPVFTVAPTTANIPALGGTIQFTATDPEGGSVFYSLTTTRAGITIDSTGLVHVTAAAAGTSGNIVVQASDGILTASATCAVAVSSTLQWIAQGTPNYTPIVRDLRGPGVNTPAGSGRTLDTIHTAGTTVTPPRILIVNSLALAVNGSGDAGTLRYCLDRHQTLGGPSTIVFDVGGTIDLTGISAVYRCSNLTIAGQSAPSPGIQIINAVSFALYGSDILLQHLTLRPKTATENTNAMYFYADTTSGDVRRIVADHLTTMWGPDQTFSINVTANTIDLLTVANCIVAEGIGKPSDSTHKYASLMGHGLGEWLSYGNLYANCKDRMPLSRGIRFAAVNNLVSNWMQSGTTLQSQDRSAYNGLASNVSIVNCRFERGADTTTYGATPIRFSSADLPLTTGSKVYLSGNARYTAAGVDDTPALQVSLVDPGTPLRAPSDWASSTATYWPTYLAADTIARVREVVLAYAGSRPGERDAQTQRLITEVTNRTGSLKDYADVAHATYSSTDVSADDRWTAPPSGGSWGDILSTGYTKLEAYLHELEDAVL